MRCSSERRSTQCTAPRSIAYGREVTVTHARDDHGEKKHEDHVQTSEQKKKNEAEKSIVRDWSFWDTPNSSRLISNARRTRGSIVRDVA